jgi:hypothetical protein
VMMTADLRTHITTIEVTGPTPPEVAAGADFVLKVRVSCASGCELAGMPVKVTSADGAVVAGEIGDEAADIALTAPRRAGEAVWNVACGPHRSADILHEEKSVPVRIGIIPHATSLAVWAIPSPVVMGEKFEIKVGAKSSAGAALTGRTIEVCDEADIVVARGRLGATPLPGTSALYWGEITLLAPVTEGICAWSVKFAPADLDLPHEPASSTFSVAVVRPPQHRLTIKVIERETAAPIANAQLRLGVYRAATDPSGLAEVDLPGGVYDLTVWKVGYEAPGRTVELNGNASVEVEVLALPEENPDAAWLM